LFPDLEADSFALGLGRGHEFADGVEDDFKLGVVSLFERRELLASSAWEARICRSRTKARMISTLTSTARRLRSTLESMATPCSVNA
jgi:hypothetical protein